jgi:dTDP-glucose 4,6-dehydratase
MGNDRIREVIESNADKAARFTNYATDLTLPIPEGLAKELGQFDYIFHVAAESHVDNSISNPVPFVQNNISSTLNILEFARTQKQLKKFLYFSTDEVYGCAAEGYEYKEGDAHNSGNPYSASKSGSEQICRSYANTYKIPVIITNTMNIIGERQHMEKFLPKVINYVLDGKILTIHSNPEKTKAGVRKYIHARNVAAGMLFVINNLNEIVKQKDAACGVYNIVGEEELDNLQIAQIVADCVTKRVPGRALVYEMTDFHSQRPGHDLRYSLSDSKLKGLGWQPPKSLREAIDKTVDWYLQPQNLKWLGRDKL